VEVAVSVTAEDCVRALKEVKLSTTAAPLAQRMGVTSRHVTYRPVQWVQGEDA
jgi:hypothetical protein